MRDNTLAVLQVIWKDLTNRRGLRQEIDQIDDDILAEMVGTWYSEVSKIYYGEELFVERSSEGDRLILRSVRGW